MEIFPCTSSRSWAKQLGGEGLKADVMNFGLDLAKGKVVGTHRHTEVGFEDSLNFDLDSGILQLCCSLELHLELTLARNMKCSPGAVLFANRQVLLVTYSLN